MIVVNLGLISFNYPSRVLPTPFFRWGWRVACLSLIYWRLHYV
ncbi:hypothetical protein VP150E351_P0217 [Vibrio phage 150E35-1]|nr:hypothetical protein VP150E351_P0217 [Vibrio phage 150E35-1]